jgi:MFS family permease
VRASIFRASAGLPATFWWLFTGVLVMALATFVFPFLALFLESRGFSATQTGLVVALFGAGSIPAGPIAGWFSDHVGRRPTLVGALAGAAALTALLPAPSSPWHIAAVTLALGGAIHAYWPAANAVVADVVPSDRYGDAYGLMYWERNAGIAISFAVGGALAAGGYERLFLADAATTLLFAALVWWKVPETRPAAPPVGRAMQARGWIAVLADRPLRDLLLLNVAFMLPLFQFMVAVPVVMSRQGLAPAHYGRAMAVNGLLIVLLQPLSGPVTRRHDPARVLALAALLVGTGYGAYAFCGTPLEYAAATAVWSLGEILAMPAVSSLVALLSPPDLRGRYQGLLALSFGVGLTLAPALGGAFLDRFGARALFGGAALLCALVAAGHLAAGARRERR